MNQKNIDEAIRDLEGDYIEIERLRAKISENIKEQIKIFSSYVEKILPIMNFIQQKGYYFRHPDFNVRSIRGPILGYIAETNLLYVYDIEERRIKEINMYNKEDKVIWIDDFIEKHDFDAAMKGLLHVVDRQKEIINNFQENITKRGNLIKKYKDLV
ncbi:hypothetical protein P9597_02440 [Aneurinibacillus migulanus]|uniref:hypothetical protein n=1 Tax=Aneurinibacillus migulanus TaxID=47500 RepID=UPI002E210909|nr:hypothetical protein [Aneurinibacillus migulanus]